MSADSQGLVGKIRQIRRNAPQPEFRSPSQSAETGSDQNSLAQLQARVAHLEQLLQGLQDSVYRESQRQENRLTEVEARLDPAALAAALSAHARDRGL